MWTRVPFVLVSYNLAITATWLSDILTEDPASRTTPYLPIYQVLSASSRAAGLGASGGNCVHFPMGKAGVRRLFIEEGAYSNGCRYYKIVRGKATVSARPVSKKRFE
jgi:hypothetical protein